MKKLLDSFRLTTKEKRGFFVLFTLLGGLILYPFVRFLLSSSDEMSLPYTLVVFSEEKDNVQQDVLADNEPYGLLSGASVPSRGELFYFDPNDLPVSSWKRLGLSDRQIQVIKNYEVKGGRFYRKEDVKKLYSISDEFYQRIEPYIQIPNKAAVPRATAGDVTVPAISTPRRDEERITATTIVHVNRADTMEWQQLRGIGPAYAGRIVRFREALGGFHAIEQLQEVYGLSEELYQQILPFLVLDERHVTKININTASKDQLMRHPYISSKQADIIVKYRHQHGAYTSLEEMRKIIVLDDGFFRKIEAYLDFES